MARTVGLTFPKLEPKPEGVPEPAEKPKVEEAKPEPVKEEPKPETKKKK